MIARHTAPLLHSQVHGCDAAELRVASTSLLGGLDLDAGAVQFSLYETLLLLTGGEREKHGGRPPG